MIVGLCAGIHQGGLDTHHIEKGKTEEVIIHPADLPQCLRQRGARLLRELGDSAPVRGGEDKDLVRMGCEKGDKYSEKAAAKENPPAVCELVFL